MSPPYASRVISWTHLVLPALAFVACAVGGVAYAVLTDRLARRSLGVARRGRAITVPMLVTLNGDQRRGRAVLDGDDIRLVGSGVNVRVARRGYAAAAVRRGQVDAEVLDFAEQRAFTDASGTRYLLGPLEEWEEAFDASLGAPTRPATRARLLRAAFPRRVLGPVLLAVLAFAAFQAVWTSGHDVEATMVRVVGDEGLESCGVAWTEEGRDEYAEVDCYSPFPKVGAPVLVRAMAWPFDESAMDHEDTYFLATFLLAGAVLVLGGVGTAVAMGRLRGPGVPLAPLPAPQVTHVVTPARQTTVELSRDAPLLDLLSAAAAREGWEGDGVAAPPIQPRHARYLMALSAGTWWPGVVLAGVGLLVEGLPHALRVALAAGSAVALLWAAFRAVTAWLAIRRAYVGQVTSEWDYRLVRSLDDEWFAVLFLGSTPHWMVLLDGPGHPAPVGRCGVRGDLRDGGAIQLQFGGEYWPTLSPVSRVDDELVSDLRKDLVERLG